MFVLVLNQETEELSIKQSEEIYVLIVRSMNIVQFKPSSPSDYVKRKEYGVKVGDQMVRHIIVAMSDDQEEIIKEKAELEKKKKPRKAVKSAYPSSQPFSDWQVNKQVESKEKQVRANDAREATDKIIQNKLENKRKKQAVPSLETSVQKDLAPRETVGDDSANLGDNVAIQSSLLNSVISEEDPSSPTAKERQASFSSVHDVHDDDTPSKDDDDTLSKDLLSSSVVRTENSDVLTATADGHSKQETRTLLKKKHLQSVNQNHSLPGKNSDGAGLPSRLENRNSPARNSSDEIFNLPVTVMAHVHSHKSPGKNSDGASCSPSRKENRKRTASESIDSLGNICLGSDSASKKIIRSDRDLESTTKPFNTRNWDEIVPDPNQSDTGENSQANGPSLDESATGNKATEDRNEEEESENDVNLYEYLERNFKKVFKKLDKLGNKIEALEKGQGVRRTAASSQLEEEVEGGVMPNHVSFGRGIYIPIKDVKKITEAGDKSTILQRKVGELALACFGDKLSTYCLSQVQDNKNKEIMPEIVIDRITDVINEGNIEANYRKLLRKAEITKLNSQELTEKIAELKNLAASQTIELTTADIRKKMSKVIFLYKNPSTSTK
ncbi:uncharacterized protein LOC127750102 [Frankliniella occidentalis]|uniref:Uncharacterized protein LOC127750102 n=1 Tax=Frankliniella occidentalis TaxID=133901 RepID=A0A9C6X0C1_FRAOC|nr:uncharacterized protein LOC127750102 [Frankliniella occidentalis]